MINRPMDFLLKTGSNCYLASQLYLFSFYHMHILFSSDPQTRLSDLINNYKTTSSRLIRKNNKEFLSKYFWKPYFWSDSYFIGTVSDVTESIVNNYINNQDKK